MLGETFQTKSYGPVQVIEDLGPRPPSPRYWKVKFIRTGSEVAAQKDNIIHGRVKDPKARTVCGIGYLDGQPKKAIPRSYQLWQNMLRRCYKAPTEKLKRAYQDKGVRVCDRWHSFRNFCEDLPSLKGYSQWVEGAQMDFDKDHRGNSAVYGPEFCCFIASTANRRRTSLIHVGYLIEGRRFTTRAEAALSLGVDLTTISRWLRGQRAADKRCASVISFQVHK